MDYEVKQTLIEPVVDPGSVLIEIWSIKYNLFP